ncbi:hypothetical protein OSB04_023436 [Centaurea solstitialis]|uniref:Uncharacterized protein n=1 Tax=Centaurea solstitialis TaxID=347529 RepID=A0AA38SKU3_9ASTR|nr:hypothetical protein OSB04_023436 [Centaurea solstitialis]
MDVKIVFLNGELDEEIYKQQANNLKGLLLKVKKTRNREYQCRLLDVAAFTGLLPHLQVVAKVV